MVFLLKETYETLQQNKPLTKKDDIVKNLKITGGEFKNNNYGKIMEEILQNFNNLDPIHDDNIVEIESFYEQTPGGSGKGIHTINKDLCCYIVYELVFEPDENIFDICNLGLIESFIKQYINHLYLIKHLPDKHLHYIPKMYTKFQQFNYNNLKILQSIIEDVRFIKKELKLEELNYIYDNQKYIEKNKLLDIPGQHICQEYYTKLNSVYNKQREQNKPVHFNSPYVNYVNQRLKHKLSEMIRFQPQIDEFYRKRYDMATLPGSENVYGHFLEPGTNYENTKLLTYMKLDAFFTLEPFKSVRDELFKIVYVFEQIGFNHGDLHAGNIFVGPINSKKKTIVKVIDFDLSEILDVYNEYQEDIFKVNGPFPECLIIPLFVNIHEPLPIFYPNGSFDENKVEHDYIELFQSYIMDKYNEFKTKQKK